TVPHILVNHQFATTMQCRSLQSRSPVDGNTHSPQDKTQFSPSTGRTGRMHIQRPRHRKPHNQTHRSGVQKEKHFEMASTHVGKPTPKVHKNDQLENEQGGADSTLNLGQILFDAFDNIGKSSAAGGLEASKWAPKTTPRNTST